MKYKLIYENTDMKNSLYSHIDLTKNFRIWRRILPLNSRNFAQPAPPGTCKVWTLHHSRANLQSVRPFLETLLPVCPAPATRGCLYFGMSVIVGGGSNKWVWSIILARNWRQDLKSYR